jgi:hypothetical protein
MEKSEVFSIPAVPSQLGCVPVGQASVLKSFRYILYVPFSVYSCEKLRISCYCIPLAHGVFSLAEETSPSRGRDKAATCLKGNETPCFGLL